MMVMPWGSVGLRGGDGRGYRQRSGTAMDERGFQARADCILLYALGGPGAKHRDRVGRGNDADGACADRNRRHCCHAHGDSS